MLLNQAALQRGLCTVQQFIAAYSLLEILGVRASCPALSVTVLFS